jgi:Fe-S-cluster containining protein
MAQQFSKEIKGIKIDPVIFSLKFSCKCNGECCYYGVYTDLKEYKLILSLKDKIIPLMDESQTTDTNRWFEVAQKDEDFDSGIAVGTELHNSKCVFLDKQGLCTLQKLAILNNEQKWKYKPLYCVLFPLTIFNGAITVDDEHIDRLKICNKFPAAETTIYEACTEELKQFFGEEGFAELEVYRKKFLAALQNDGDSESSREVA